VNTAVCRRVPVLQTSISNTSLPYRTAVYADNLAYSCSLCNHYKGPNIAAADPETGEPTFLFHPRRHTWADHFTLDGAVIEPQTPEGRATVAVLHFNDQPRVEQRAVLIQLRKYPCTKA
jgi:hypothetical protein